MTSKLGFRLFAALIVLAVSALAQIDGTNLRSKYGPPLTRETFTVMTGVEMIVDYATNGHACRIQLPPVGPSKDPVVISTQAIDEFIAGLVPITIRGKELRRWMSQSGIISVSAIEYENVVVAEAAQAGRRTGVTVTFTKEECRDQFSR